MGRMMADEVVRARGCTVKITRENPREKEMYSILDGLRHGIWAVWWYDGRRREAVYYVGMMHGNYRQWHANGVPLMAVAHINNKTYGIERLWREDGSLLSEFHYRDDGCRVPLNITI